MKEERLHRTHEEIARDINANAALIMIAEEKLKQLKEKEKQLLEEEKRKKYSLVELLRRGC